MGQLILFPYNSFIFVQLDIFGHYSQFSWCIPSLYCLLSVMGRLTSFLLILAFWSNSTFWPPFPALADAIQIFTFSRSSWVNSPHFRMILEFWSNLTFWPLFLVLADAVQIFTFSRPSLVNSPHFRIILAFWSNLTLCHHCQLTIMGKLASISHNSRSLVQHYC